MGTNQKRIIGLIGGMSWHSSIIYYQIINTKINELLGGHHNAKSVMETVDFEDIATYTKSGNWEEIKGILIQSAKNLAKAGADFFAITANTMHFSADEVEKQAGIPLVHIVDAVGEMLTLKKIKVVALLGTLYTMEMPFFSLRLEKNFGIKVLVPDQTGKDTVNNIIYDELTFGKIREHSQQVTLTVLNDLKAQGAQGIILGCTELGLLINRENSPLAVFDSAKIHAEKIAIESLRVT